MNLAKDIKVISENFYVFERTKIFRITFILAKELIKNNH